MIDLLLKVFIRNKVFVKEDVVKVDFFILMIENKEKIILNLVL